MGLPEADLFALGENAKLLCSQNEKSNTEKQKPHLSETIDYDTDIAPYQFTKIFSGVGSGKNYFINNLVLGGQFKHHDGTPVRPMCVLLLSPRKAKIQETLNLKDVHYDPCIGMFDSPENDWMADAYERYADLPLSKWIELKDALGDSHEVCLRSCVYTNAKLEKDLQDRYSASNPLVQPWKRFDMIVVDEVHSLFSDATYQTAGFYVRRLIQQTLKYSKDCKVIVMTGTPEILEGVSLFKKAHLIDRMNICVNVTPKAVRFITRAEAAELQLKLLLEKEKFVAFYNHVADIFAFEDKVPPEARQGIAMSFSKREILEKMKKEEDPRYQKMIDTQCYLAEHENLPDDVYAFLSTSKNKEGINIKNQDIHTMFVEAHAALDVVQMAGRLRKPVDTLYVVVDSIGHPDKENSQEYRFALNKRYRAGINEEYMKECQKTGYSPNDPEAFFQEPAYSNAIRRAFIDLVHKRDSFLRYDFFTDRFMFYGERKVGKAYYENQDRIFAQARTSEMNLMLLGRTWFPNARVTVSNKVKFVCNRQTLIDEYFEQRGWLDRESLGAVERDIMLLELNRLLQLESKQLKSLLKKYGYDMLLLENSHKKNATFKVIKRPTKKAA